MAITTGTTATTTPSQPEQLTRLLDREAIVNLLERWAALLDEQRFDDLRSVFAADASITTPRGHAEGIEAILTQAWRGHRPEVRTQHLMTGYNVDIDDDRASVRVNYVGIFATGDGPIAPAPVFKIGSVYHLQLVRTDDGWRIHSLEMRPSWAEGEPPFPQPTSR